MRLLYSRDDWSYAGGFREPSLDFCLWVLQVDGLRVPPFDQHPDGDSSLQLKISKDPHLPPPPEFHFYHASWRGNNTVRNRLIELHKQYKHVSDHHEQLCADVSRARDKYEVTFQEIDREQHRMIFILQQNEDGSWCLDSSGSSIDMQNEWSEIVAPVRDHPLIFLSPHGIYLDNQTHLLTAYGDVIDNGFHVKQVRLVNDAGQVLEDTVENGYVFFACKLELRVQLPMQAELYDHQGKLVWQEAVTIDGGLPPWLK